MKIVVASRNRHKVHEIGLLWAETFGAAVELVTIDDVAPGTALIEEEDTFEANAVVKAQQAARATGLPALADDSGLEVDALNGAPGVWSARYAGLPSDDARNNAKLLAALDGVGPAARTGRFRCAAAFVDEGAGIELVTAGAFEGRILAQAQGMGGFGYDPLFFIPALGKTMAEITTAEKNALSHRAQAFRALAKEVSARGLLPALSPGQPPRP